MSCICDVMYLRCHVSAMYLRRLCHSSLPSVSMHHPYQCTIRINAEVTECTRAACPFALVWMLKIACIRIDKKMVRAKKLVRVHTGMPLKVDASTYTPASIYFRLGTCDLLTCLVCSCLVATRRGTMLRATWCGVCMLDASIICVCYMHRVWYMRLYGLGLGSVS